MSVIHLSELKKSYEYGEIIGQDFVIPIKRGKSYTSPTERNGYNNQAFSSDDMADELIVRCFGTTKCPTDGRVHPVCYSLKNLVDGFYLKGLQGYQCGPDELNLICKIFGGNNGILDVRCISKTDVLAFSGLETLGDSKFWIASRNANTNFVYSYFSICKFDRNVSSVILYVSNDCERYCSYGIRPIFTLNAEVNTSLK